MDTTYHRSFILASCAAFFTACIEPDSGPEFREVPVPVGNVAAEVEEVALPIKLLASCLADTSPLALPARALVTVEVLDQADGDDQQPFTVTITSHGHEDQVACLRDTVAAWAGEP